MEVRDDIDYIAAALNHAVPGLPSYHTGSLLDVGKRTKPKEHDFDKWHIVTDASLGPYKGLSRISLTGVAVKSSFVGGMELVSPVFNLDAEQTWLPQIKHIFKDLTPEISGCKLCLNGKKGFHVHLGMKHNEDLPLPTVQRLLAVYGLFEREIERWHPVSRRNQRGDSDDQNKHCASLRFKMQKDMCSQIMDVQEVAEPKYSGEGNRFAVLEIEDDAAPRQQVLRPGEKYTPEGYLEWLFAATGILDLVWAFQADGGCMEKEVAVYIHQRFVEDGKPGGKPMTLEFRHHGGTLSTDDIKWWIRFCGALVRYAHRTSGEKGNFRDAEEKRMSLAELLKMSVLDLIGFEEEGKAHFAERKSELWNEEYEKVVEQDERAIELRRQTRKGGGRSGGPHLIS